MPGPSVKLASHGDLLDDGLVRNYGNHYWKPETHHQRPHRASQAKTLQTGQKGGLFNHLNFVK
jgi:hypothetical protein